MRSAIAFAAVLIVFGVFMPDVLHAVNAFLLVFFGKATAFLSALPTQPAAAIVSVPH